MSCDFAILGEAHKHVDVLLLLIGDSTSSGCKDIDAQSFMPLLLYFVSDIAEGLLIIVNIFCFGDTFCKESGCENWVLSTGSLMRQYETVDSIKSGGGDLGELGSLWLVFCYHRIDQL